MTLRRSSFVPLGLFALALAACGGSSPPAATGNSNGPGGGAGGPTTGKVTVLLTDAPGTDWDEAHATITSIELLGQKGHQSLFSGQTTVDLLSLPDFYEVFAVADAIEPDTFEKIRLYVDELRLVERDDEGMILQDVQAQLVGNGKIDLNPDGDFIVGPGDSLYVEIDFDMHKAFKTTTTGKGRVIVRPVIHVNVTRVPPLGRLTRLRGIIGDIDLATGEFELCQQGLVSESGHESSGSDDEGESEDADHDSDDDSHCMDIETDDLTGIFDAAGLPEEFANLESGMFATVIGHLRRDDDADDDDDDSESGDDDADDDSDDGDHAGERQFDDIVLHAVTVELGEAFVRAAGTADSFVDGDVFDLALEPGQQLGTAQEVLATQLFPKTRIFRKHGEELGIDAIAPGVGVLADGVLVQREGVDDLLRAALLVLDLDPVAVDEVLRGEIVSVDFDAGTFQLLVGDTETCVNAREADIFLVSNVDGFLSERGGLGDLEPGQSADAFGVGTDADGCFVATDVLASALPGNTMPVADAGDDRSVAPGEGVTLDGTASSDADGDGLSYAWQFVSVPDGNMAELAAADTAMPSFTPVVAGTYVIELVVNDGLEDSAPDTVTITVSAE